MSKVEYNFTALLYKAYKTERKYIQNKINNQLIVINGGECDLCKHKINDTCILIPVIVNNSSCCVVLCEECFLNIRKKIKYDSLMMLEEYCYIVASVKKINFMEHKYIVWYPPRFSYVPSRGISNPYTDGIKIINKTKLADRPLDLQQIKHTKHDSLMIESKTAERIKLLDVPGRTAEDDINYIFGEGK